MTAPDLLRDVVASLPATDPVGAICAAIHRYDRTVDRLVLALAVATGQTEDVVRVAHGLAVAHYRESAGTAPVSSREDRP